LVLDAIFDASERAVNRLGARPYRGTSVRSPVTSRPWRAAWPLVSWGVVLPPLLAGAAGSVRATFGENPFERLIQDYRSVLSLLERMAGGVEASAARRVAALLALKRS
jgi:hypothetical protein